jgi:hypothetical protein
MSTQETILPLNLPAAERAVNETATQRLGAALERGGEWINPLLVKECRQALKSKWFAIIFTLVLVACWGWSVVGVARLGPDMPYQFYGPDMFYGYYVILAAPLMIIPFSAFRSLISEREDNTFELVAITTLRPRQIIGGKLGSAVLQMLVYFSAVAPCLAFTYLLRGLDVITICFILYYTFMASVGFSLIALFIATLAKEKHWQIILSVVIIIGLFYAFGGALAACHEIMRHSRMPIHEPWFWELNLALLTAFCGVFALLYLAAGAQLTFPSENRSTPLRITMVVHQVLFVGWLGYVAVRYGVQENQRDAIGMCSMLLIAAAALYWYFMGSLMTGEASKLSERVKRSLPRTNLGRMFFTWLNPGPGTGYMFAMSSLFAAAVLAIAGAFWWDLQGRMGGGGPSFEGLLAFNVLVVAYVAIYLGCTNLFLRLIRRVADVTVVTSMLLNMLLLLAGWGIPWLIREMTDYRGTGYTLLHITDPFWSCATALDSRIGGGGGDREQIMWIILPVAAAVFLLNLIYIAPELQQARVAPPKRVEDEELELHPVHAPQPTNPWD